MTPTDDSALLAACAAFTGQQEGSTDFMYLDATGNVTCGVGHLIPTPLAAHQIFDYDDDGADIAAQFGAVRSAQPGFPAEKYASLTTARLPQPTIDSLFRMDILAHINTCRAQIPGFNRLPVQAQTACVDIDFNVRGGVRTFSKMIAAMLAGNWAEAAIQSNRPQLPARSAATKALIGSIPQAMT